MSDERCPERAMDAEQENAELRALLMKGYALFSDAYLIGEKPDDIKRGRAFCSFDKALRDRGLIGPQPK